MGFIYRRTEPTLWTVGHYEDGKWQPESDHDNADDAAKRTRWLNGGGRGDDAPNTEADGPFDQWAIVELLGHRRLAGRVREVTLAGAGVLRAQARASGGDL